MSEIATVLVWVDLETTGLETTGTILESAVVLTDLALNTLDVYETIVPQNVPDALGLMDAYCKQMHTDNGLINELIQASSTDPNYLESIVTIEQEILNRLERARAQFDGGVIFVIAGSTVGFDKGWIKAHMPRLFKALHYRQLDVSTYKVGFPEIFGAKTSEAHRAMPDIRVSIEQHRKMREIVSVSLSQTVGFKPFVEPTFDEDDCC